MKDNICILEEKTTNNICHGCKWSFYYYIWNENSYNDYFTRSVCKHPELKDSFYSRIFNEDEFTEKEECELHEDYK